MSKSSLETCPETPSSKLTVTRVLETGCVDSVNTFKSGTARLMKPRSSGLGKVPAQDRFEEPKKSKQDTLTARVAGKT